MDTGLVGKGAEASDRVVEGHVDLNGLGDEVLNLWTLFLSNSERLQCLGFN
jgi:hypothetical protein